MVILRMAERVLEARNMGGQFDGQVVLIPRITLNPTSSNSEFPFKL